MLRGGWWVSTSRSPGMMSTGDGAKWLGGGGGWVESHKEFLEDSEVGTGVGSSG